MKRFEDLEYMFEKGLNAWQEQILEQEAKKIGLNAVGVIKPLTPVITGLLRRRWTVKVDREGDQVVIWILNNTHYAAAVNYGHRIVRGGKTYGKTKGKYMLENGLYLYRRNQMGADVRTMLERLREVL